MGNNRHQRRRHNTLFRRSDIKSVPRDDKKLGMRPNEDLVTFLQRMEKDVPVNDGSPPCDWPGCMNEWHFATHATIGGKRKVIAVRCAEHRLAQV